MHLKDTARIPLLARSGSVRAYALIDTMDLSVIQGAPWRLRSDGYAYRWDFINGHRKSVLMHRLILGLPFDTDGRQGDHVNRDRLDNRRLNLRVVTHSQNMQNRPSHKGSRSKYRGVWWNHKAQKWQARIRVNGKRIGAGLFTDEASAGEAARLARLKYMPYAAD
jgi:hypothetical protein